MKAFYKLLALALTVVTFSSCEKVIDLKLKDTPPQLVIEGGVSNMLQSPVVRISRSVNFDQPSSFPAVSGATVKVTSGSTSIFFTEVSPGVYQTSPVVGLSNRNFTLQVDVEGQTYKATSTMPARVLIDSVAVDEQTFRNETTKTVIVYYTDPPTIKNQYRFILSINGVLIKEVYVRNDEFNDGKAVRVALYQDDVDIKTGDRVDIEMQGIDPQVYTYWYTFSKQSGNGMGNGSIAPSNPPNNFDKPVLGYFSAYTLNRRTFTVR